MAKGNERESGEERGDKRMKGRPWCHGGDSIYRRGRSWILDFRHKEDQL